MESGTTYHVQLLTTGGSLIVQQIDLASTVVSITFPLVDFSAYTTLRVRMWAERDGYTNWQIFDHEFDRVP